MRNREEAATAAENTNFNIPDTCQLTTRTWFDAPSVGDFDGDGAADAEDGWKSEPIKARHSDRNPPRGVPVSYLGGSNDNGHRAISLGNGKIRSTDAAGRGRVATVSLDWPETTWKLRYVGWSDTMDGILIPLPPAPTRGPNVDAALKATKKAEKLAPEGTRRDRLLERAIRNLRRIPFVNRGQK
jgi:hypothetical protein